MDEYYDEELLNDYYSLNNSYQKENDIKSLEEQKNNITNKLSKIKYYLSNLYQDKVDGVISTDNFKLIVEKYNNDEFVYNNQIKSINKDINYLKNKDYKRFDNFRKINKLTKRIVDLFIDKIYIDIFNNEGEIRDIYIKWNL